MVSDNVIWPEWIQVVIWPVVVAQKQPHSRHVKVVVFIGDSDDG